MFSHSVRSIEFADAFRDLVTDQAAWSQATFGSDETRGPIGPLKHLEKEAREAYEAFGRDGIIGAQTEELADCFLLILDASRRAGIAPMDLVKAAQAKLEINKRRTWPNAGNDEPVEHVA